VTFAPAAATAGPWPAARRTGQPVRYLLPLPTGL